MSSWSNVQVYWSPAKSCSCDWSVANWEEKTGPALPPCCWTQNIHTTKHRHWHTSQLLVLCCSYSVCYVQTILINQSFCFFFKWRVFSSTMKMAFMISVTLLRREVEFSKASWAQAAWHCPVLRSDILSLSIIALRTKTRVWSRVITVLLTEACRLVAVQRRSSG